MREKKCAHKSIKKYELISSYTETDLMHKSTDYSPTEVIVPCKTPVSGYVHCQNKGQCTYQGYINDGYIPVVIT